ncbi:hypothetical protein QBC39DRAFT_372428 [Podospora conica]|nr:hypothetical protein QBC39DRAFT_372428 [Schizothecium conicum]
MHLPSLTLAVLAVLRSTSATSLPSSRAHLTTFVLSTSAVCDNHQSGPNSLSIAVPYGSACGQCTALPATAASLRSISIASLDSRCRVTLFKTGDCTGEGVAPWAGGCWSSGEGLGMKGYKVECPWYDDSEGRPEVCTGDREGLGKEVKELRRRESKGECAAEQD